MDGSRARATDHLDPRHCVQSTGLSNGRLEGLNTKVKAICRRSFGFHSPEPLIALIYLCCGGVRVELPMR